MSDGFEVIGTNDSAPFSLKLHRGDGMTPAGHELEERQATRRLRRLRHRVQGARRQTGSSP